MVERTHFHNGRVMLEASVASGDGIRHAGTDYAAGETLLRVGTVLDSARIGLAASAGCAVVEAYRRPHVAVLSTGDELVGITETPGPGQIRDSNRLALLAAVEEAGGIPIDGGHVGDSDEATEALTVVARAADAVVTSGGVSMGHRDRVKPWLAENGELVFGRVRMKPGKPATFGLVDGTPVFALPGFPVSALVTFELFVRPAILRMTGHPDSGRPVWRVALAEDVPTDVNRVEFARAHVRLGDSGPTARTTGAQGSGRLLSLADANGLLRLDHTSAVVPAGTIVPAMILGRVDGNHGHS
jgi:molybdenum cofactor synthesis domain-containing protein